MSKSQEPIDPRGRISKARGGEQPKDTKSLPPAWLMEKLAKIEHDRWSEWQEWCHRILRQVRDVGAVDDNNGAEDWTLSDKAIEEAKRQIIEWALELLPEHKTLERVTPDNVGIANNYRGFNQAIDQMEAELKGEA